MKIILNQEEIIKALVQLVKEKTGIKVKEEDVLFNIISEQGDAIGYESVEAVAYTK